MNPKFREFFLTAVLSAAVIPGMALAQLEEVTVTAERRTANIQDVPISVQAFSADELTDVVVTQPVQLGQIVPGLQYSKQTGQANPYIRGIGTQNTAVGDESTVATYVDGVYIMGMQAAATSFNNIERVEVLKGPQGTLFGRNTTGGLIQIITRDPVHEPEFRFGIDYGEYETWEVNLYGSTGLSDTVAADLSVYYSDQGEGFGENLVTGSDVNITEDLVARTKWLVQPNEDVTLKLSLDYARTKTDVASARGPMEGAIGIDGGLVFQGCLGTGAGFAACSAAAQANGTGHAEDFWDTQANVNSPSEAEQLGGALHLTWQMPEFDVVSITAYRDTEVEAVLDQDAVRLQVIDAVLDREEDQFSQELQLVSNNSDNYNWIIGAFFMDAESSYSPFQLEGLGLPLLAPGVTFVDMEVTQSLTSYSLFAQGTYDITEALSITGGVRWTEDEREMDGVTTISFGPVDVPLPFDVDETFSEPTWRLALDYRVSDDMMLYASYNRGFKSGLFNSVVSSGMPSPAVDPEIIDAYEVGLKSDWMDGRMRANLAIFFYDYEDLQLQFVNAGATVLGNAASAEIWGSELTVLAAVSDNLDLRLGLSWLDAEYTDYPDAPISTPSDLGFGPIGGNSVTNGDVSGNKMARAPDFTSSLGANYTRTVLDGLKFKANINWYYNDGFYWYEDNRVKQESYDVINAAVSLGHADDDWTVRLWVKNLTDEEYSIFTNTGQFGDLVAPARPRVAGVGVEFRF